MLFRSQLCRLTNAYAWIHGTIAEWGVGGSCIHGTMAEWGVGRMLLLKAPHLEPSSANACGDVGLSCKHISPCK